MWFVPIVAIIALVLILKWTGTSLIPKNWRRKYQEYKWPAVERTTNGWNIYNEESDSQSSESSDSDDQYYSESDDDWSSDSEVEMVRGV